ncbi:hypothetical protein J1N35_032567 [Gossypium stocksii]|uniref:U1-type domain-containing protein n=1 Tax=Gossypium stocksii TaxID=47602 RepID=A0A9D3V425_9ROSI|nr:hypothetical protein J1N35_032567 [Gossypium stocksii]
MAVVQWEKNNYPQFEYFSPLAVMYLAQYYGFYCLCNTKATSQQTLLLHAEGKKHRAKARAFHAKQQPEQMEASALDTKALTENKANSESLENKPKGKAKPQDLPKDGHVQINSEASNGDISSKKKRKLDVPVTDITEIQSVDDSSGKACNVVREDKAAFITDKEDNKRKIKWKKFIKAALKSGRELSSHEVASRLSKPDGVLKMRKLQKLVLKALQESGVVAGNCRTLSATKSQT